MDLNKKLEELKPYQLNCNVFDVYSYNGLTMQDLLCQFFTKINECITVSNETIDLAKWLVNEGLEIEVVKKLMIWLEDGTLENIINVNLFNTLNEKINGLSSQLEYNVNRINNRTLKDKLCYKKILYNLPLLFDDYNNVIIYNNCSYVYPQSFAIDKKANELLILYSPDTSTVKGNRWIVIYDLTSNEYKTCFSAGESGGEGIEVLYEGINRYLYVKSIDSCIGKYDITILPSKMQVLLPVEEFDVGLYYDFTYSNGKWLVEQTGSTMGIRATRKVLTYFNKSFEQKGSIVTNTSDVGFWDSSSKYMNMLPKRQGLALAGDVIYQATGGYWGVEQIDVVPFSYQGIKILNLNGELKEESLLDPHKMREKFLESGIGCSRIEYEGVKVVDDKLLSMIVVLGRFDTNSYNEGLLIVEEMNEEGIDFTDCKVEYSPFNLEKLNGMYPRTKSNGELYNVVTGEKLVSINDIIEYMIETGLTDFKFYSSAVSIDDLNNVKIENGILVELQNVNNSTLFMTYTGDNNKSKKFILYKNNEIYVQKEISNFTEYSLELINGVTPFYNKDVIVKKDGNIVNITGMINNVPEGNVIIGNVPEIYRPRHNVTFVVALSSSASGGYGVVVVKTDGNIEVVFRSMNTSYICLNGINYIV